MGKTFADRLRWAMERKGIRQVDLSKWTGLSDGMISQYLSGMSVPREENLKKIAYVVGASPAFLLGYEDTQVGFQTLDSVYSLLTFDDKKKVLEYAEMLLDKEQRDVQG